MRIVAQKQDQVSAAKRIINVLCCILLAMVFCGLFILGHGQNPIQVYLKMFKSAFGSQSGFIRSIVTSIPLMFCSLGVAVAFRMGINNIGAEGQYSMGAFAATGVALYCKFIPQSLTIPAMFLAAFVCGALWGLIAIIPNALWKVNDTISTLMMNYVALLFIDYLCYGPWIDRDINLPVSNTIPEYARLTKYFGTNLNASLIIAIVIAILIYLFFKYTVSGYQIKVISQNPYAAKYAGISVVSKILIVMLVSGGIAGLAGFAQVSGQVYKLQSGIANNAGFTGIVIAYLSKFNPFVILIVSVFFGGLTIGGYAIQVMGVPSQIVTMLQGAILLFVLGGEILTKYKFTVIRSSKIKKEMKEEI
jgi:simple sugar transport system permease protein